MDSYERQPQGSRVDDDQTQTPRGEGREARGSLVYQEDRHARKDTDSTSPKPTKGPEPTSMSLPSDSTTPVSATVLSPQPQATFTSAHNQQEEADTENSGNRHPRQLGLGRPITRSPGQDVIEEDATPQSPPRRPAQLQPATRELTSSTQTRVSSTYGGLKDTSSSKEAGGYFDEKDRDGKDLSRRSTTLHHRVEAPLPILPRNGSDTVHDLRRATRTMDGYVVTGNPPSRQRSGIDWIVPVEEKAPLSLRPKTVQERLQPTIDIAKESRDRFARKARYTGYLLNGAIGLQVLLGSLTTGLSAVATTGRQMAVQTTILGGLTTVVAGYLARTRGSNEPELSTSRVKDLEKYIREATAYVLDFGHLYGPDHDTQIEYFRMEFEQLLGNGSGERKLASV